jgi:trans-2,3-dihydro-3-hydroxyanthranilate isomerase
MGRSCTVVRVFTRGDVGGNHLGVITDLTGLNDRSMQAIATELGYSESTFVVRDPQRPPLVRIFTPADELPFAGHPLVGTAWVLNRLLGGSHDTLRCGIGDVAVRHEGEMTWIETPMSGKVVASDDVLPFLQRAQIAGGVATGRVMLPKEYLIGEFESFAAVAELEPDMSVLAEVFGVLAYARVDDHVLARFFAPATAVDEDPATGSAAVALATLLAARGEGSGRLSIDQGESIGAPSRIELEWSGGTAAIGGTVANDGSRRLEI